MENKKYFTPNIEDFHIGYQYEIFQKGKPYDINVMHFMPQPEEDTWVKMTYPDAFLGYNLKRMFEIYQIRVPYLTKEQIEAEGWEYVKNTNTVDIDICHIFNKENFMLGWFPFINKIAVLVRDPSKAFDINGVIIEYNNTNRYTGECKDINTFRLIQKLLGIK